MSAARKRIRPHWVGNGSSVVSDGCSARVLRDISCGLDSIRYAVRLEMGGLERVQETASAQEAIRIMDRFTHCFSRWQRLIAGLPDGRRPADRYEPSADAMLGKVYQLSTGEMFRIEAWHPGQRVELMELREGGIGAYSYVPMSLFLSLLRGDGLEQA